MGRQGRRIFLEYDTHARIVSFKASLSEHDAHANDRRGSDASRQWLDLGKSCAIIEYIADLETIHSSPKRPYLVIEQASSSRCRQA